MSHQSELIGSDILAYLAQHERKGLLRLLTCGNVDDGKSTLIGRLLHDSKLIYEDQLAAVRQDSAKFGTTGDDFDPALLMDGLQAEREQGITIDVAYRYFSTAKRKFIIADTPGHEQYTRNMATGASNCDLAIILIDARHGLRTQTKRHSFIVSLLGIRHVIVAVNKMDLVGYSPQVFETIRQDYLAFVQALDLPDIRFIPLSALKGDNVVNRSAAMPWYDGPPLMELLDNIEIDSSQGTPGLRFPVQWVNRPNLDFRGFSGTLAAGTVKPGDAVTVLPSRKTSRVKSIVTYDGELAEAFAPQAVTLTLEDEIDASRGDMLVSPDDEPALDSRVLAHVVWMAEAPLTPAQPYYVKQTTKRVSGSIAQIRHRIDVNTLEQHPARQLKLNEIGLCELALNAPIAFDPYTRCKATGSFIIIDRLSHTTVAAGMILGPIQRGNGFRRVSPLERSLRLGQKGVTLWLEGDGADAAAYDMERRLFDRGYVCAVLDATQLGGQLAGVAQALNAAGIICIAAVDHAPAGEADVIVPVDAIDLDAILARVTLPADIQPDFDI